MSRRVFFKNACFDFQNKYQPDDYEHPHSKYGVVIAHCAVRRSHVENNTPSEWPYKRSKTFSNDIKTKSACFNLLWRKIANHGANYTK